MTGRDDQYSTGVFLVIAGAIFEVFFAVFEWTLVDTWDTSSHDTNAAMAVLGLIAIGVFAMIIGYGYGLMRGK